jgi:hypothetical protein
MFAKSLFGALLLLIAMTFAAAPAAAESSSMGRWFSFGKGKPNAQAKTTNASGTSKSIKTPQVVTKMTDGTKRLVSNTANVFTPGKTTTTRKSGTTGFVKAQKPPQEKQGFFKSMFNPEPPPPPKTVKEWMSLKQIHP